MTTQVVEGVGLRRLSVENELLAITFFLNQTLAHIKNSSSSTFSTINIVLIIKSRDMSRDDFAKNRKLLTNWWPV